MLTIEYVKERIENEKGYVLLSNVYINAHKKLQIKCDKGHIYETRWDIFNQGHRCPKCSTEFNAFKLKHSLNYIKIQIENEGYQLLSNEYKNARSPLKIKCPKDHIYKTNWHIFQMGGRCPKCIVRKPRKTIEEINHFTTSIGYKLLSKKYINAIEKLKFECPEGHMFEVCWNSFGSDIGSRCPICWNIKNRGPNHHMWKGGKSFEPYCEIFSDKEFRGFIKQRDENKCLNPDCTKKSTTLTIHHIDYDKKNCDQKNLITICISCNSRANKDREWHTSWYRAIMYQRYNFIYKGESF